jgi:hypothetical protein
MSRCAAAAAATSLALQIRFATPRFAYVTSSAGTLSSSYNERDNKW